MNAPRRVGIALLCGLALLACQEEAIPERGKMEALKPPDGGRAKAAKKPKPLVPPLPPAAPMPDGGAPAATAAPAAAPEDDKPPKEGMIRLQWAMPPKSGSAYSVWMEPVLPSRDPLRGLGAEQVLARQDMDPAWTRRLKRMVLPSRPSFTVLLTPSYEGRILSRWIFNGFHNPKALPPKVGRGVELATGMVKLRAEFKPSGKIYTLLQRGHQNMMAPAFALPEGWLAEGSTWEVDVKPGIPRGFDYQTPRILSQGRLNKIRQSEDGPVAQIQLRVAYLLEGDYHEGAGQADPLRMDFVFIAKGEFAVDQGRWLSLRGYLHERAEGAIELDDRRLFAVRSLERLPPEAQDLLKAE